MNDLNLRVSAGIGEKVKKPLAPITMPYWSCEEIGDENDQFCKEFLNSTSADEQLKIMKQFLNNHKDLCQGKMVEFLVLLFWHADAKHPVKGFLKKHIADSSSLREPFTKCLTSVITKEISELSSNTCYADYIGIVTRLDACIDKFSPGATAVSSLEIQVATCVVNCLESCIATLGNAGGKEQNSDEKSQPLAPTEINKIYDLVHLTLRLLLYMIQKVTDHNRDKLNSMFEKIRSITKELMSGKDVPMDTKSVSGIVDFTLYVFENGPDSWIELLEQDHGWSGTITLCMCSAVATTVPADALLRARVGDQPAVLRLTDTIVDIGDRYSSDSSHALAVARTLLAISKSLPLACPTVGSLLTARLARACWARLEHHLDSVRHLACALLARVVAAAAAGHEGGDPEPLDSIYSALASLSPSGRGLFAALAALAACPGARLMARRPDLPTLVLNAVGTQHVQAVAANLLETLLKNQMAESGPEDVYKRWLSVILERVKVETDPSVLNILEKILAKAVQWDDRILEYILPDQRALSSYEGSDLKCVLLVLGVVRKSGVAYKFSQDELRHTAYDADDEIRILSLSLVADSPRSTQPFSGEELSFVLHFLEYNANAQSPNFRQLVLANMKKILKRTEDSYKVLQRHKDKHATEISYYLTFIEDLRAQCFDSLVVGANYGRRCCALQVLSWVEALQIEAYQRIWTKKRAEILHNTLDDSYENNKVLALDVLRNCPVDILNQLEDYGSECYVEEALQQASSLKPTDCVSAAYKLLLHVRNEPPSGKAPEYRRLLLIRHALSLLSAQAAVAARVARVRGAPMFGLTHVIHRLIVSADARAIAGNAEWSSLIAEVIEVCGVVNSRVECVVAADSPEGFMPDDDGAAEDERPVTAQMVLLCAWRAVKETSLLLGELVSHLTLEGEDPRWTLSARQVEGVGETLIALLGAVKHRGAFEQAYVGFTVLLGRLWKCKSPRLHQLPLRWYSSIEQGFLLPPAGHRQGEYCDTRRGAGLPFMIQALVTTELATESSAPRGRLLTRCLDLCLRAASNATSFSNKSVSNDTSSSKAPCLISAANISNTMNSTDSNASSVLVETSSSNLSNLISALIIPNTTNATASNVAKSINETSVNSTSHSNASSVVNTASNLAVAQSNVMSVSNATSDSISVSTVTCDSDTVNISKVASEPNVSNKTGVSNATSDSTVTSDSNEASVSSVTSELNAANVARAHLVLRSLVRHAEPPADAVATALRAAIRGAAADTWTERNSSTLLFSALTVRIFGVQRGKDARKLCVRNRMTGRIFFLRYPELYDFMLEELKSVDVEGELRPSLFPTLLLLARLYPSALEGTVSNLKLSRFLPLVCWLARARDAAARRLAARAAAPLVAPHRYIPHMESLFLTLSDKNIKKNLCHGILCQLSVLLESPPPNLPTDLASTRDLMTAVRATFWLVDQPCWLVADEFLAVLNLLLMRFPGCLYNELITIETNLENALFNSITPKITSGREIYLSNAVYMYIIILTLTCREESIISLLLKCLKHPDYEVKISALNYLLMLHDQNEDVCNFLEHLNQVTDKHVLHKFHDSENYVKSLCDASKSFYLECKQKALKVLTYTPNTQKDIVATKLGTTGELTYELMLSELLDSAENAHGNLRSIYLGSALKLVSKSRNVGGSVLSVARAILAACAPTRGDAEIVVDFFQSQLVRMLCIVPKDPDDEFEYEATLLSTAAMLLEDACPRRRRRAARAVSAALRDMKSISDSQAVCSARAARELREFVQGTAFGAALLVVLAMMDFRADVAGGDELGDESRVFDQNETHNVFLEEFTWSKDCALKIREIHENSQQLLRHTYTAEQFVRSLANDNRYRPTIEKLCIENAVDILSKNAKSTNPKVNLFFEVLNQ